MEQFNPIVLRRNACTMKKTTNICTNRRCFFSSSAFLDWDFSSNNFMSAISPEILAILRFMLLSSRTNSSLCASLSESLKYEKTF